MRSLLATTLLVAAARGQIFSCKDDKVWPSSVDGRQNPPNATGNYVEWWFFTAFSPSEDVGIALSYSPMHHSVSAMVYEHAATPSLANVTSVGRQFDSSHVGVSNATQFYGTDGTTSVTVVDEHTYLVRGAIPAPEWRETLYWSLQYTQDVDAAREHVDLSLIHI